MEYCISIAARTRIGYSPYSPPICITTSTKKTFDQYKIFYSTFSDEKFLQINHNGLKHRLQEIISQPW